MIEVLHCTFLSISLCFRMPFCKHACISSKLTHTHTHIIGDHTLHDTVYVKRSCACCITFAQGYRKLLKNQWKYVAVLGWYCIKLQQCINWWEICTCACASGDQGSLRPVWHWWLRQDRPGCLLWVVVVVVIVVMFMCLWLLLLLLLCLWLLCCESWGCDCWCSGFGIVTLMQLRSLKTKHEKSRHSLLAAVISEK